MANEQFIRGKHDDGKHDGKAAERRRLAESDDVLTTFWPEFYRAKLKGTLEDEAEFHPVKDELATE